MSASIIISGKAKVLSTTGKIIADDIDVWVGPLGPGHALVFDGKDLEVRLRDSDRPIRVEGSE